ncbi:MAG: DUF4339 domain-containing protein [Bauldia sp.]|nr:DUF4339 domain-containing protein [Bauldia sp.]
MIVKPVQLLLAAVVAATVVGPAFAQTPKPIPPAQPQPGLADPAALTPPPVPPPTAGGPPPVPQVAAPMYFYVANGQPFGPIPIDSFRALVRDGTVTRQTLVWIAGMPNWDAAETRAELIPLFEAAAPPAVPQAEVFRQLVVGAWTGEARNPNGVIVSVQVLYNADGTYSGVVTQTFQGLASPSPIEGRWTVVAVNENRFALTNSPTMGQPSTETIRVIDQNTLLNETQNYQVRRVR